MEKTISFTLNGKPTTTTVQTHETVYDLFNRDLGLKSVRTTCGIGMCGACTILVDGEMMTGCIYLAPLLNGKEVTTLEGVGSVDTLDPIQESFLEKMGFQCSYCTPGMILATRSLLAENPTPTVSEIKEHLAGNLCRCGSYVKIIESVQLASEKLATN